jgi:hypothetical protein
VESDNMIVSVHAIRRLKKRKLAPKSKDGHKAREYVKKCIRSHTIKKYLDYDTGAIIYVTKQFTAVVCGSRVVTIYANGEESNDELRTRRLQEL